MINQPDGKAKYLMWLLLKQSESIVKRKLRIWIRRGKGDNEPDK